MKIGIIGGGSWGTALAQTFASKGHQVYIWVRRADARREIKLAGENKQYLPEVILIDTINIVGRIEDAIESMDVIVMAVPTQQFRRGFTDVAEMMDEKTIVLNVAKGIEEGSLLTLSQVAKEIMPSVKFATLSGPSHAEEVGRFQPTTVAIAAYDIDIAKHLQKNLMTDRFRIYTNTDLLGVELGGALKNIIALGTGISDGIGFGDNARAAIMTRGLREISRLGCTIGAKAETFSGLTGMGDLIVTCDSMYSRNRRCGISLGQGMSLKEAVEKIGMVVEGVTTTEAAYELAKNLGVEMPITETIYRILSEEIAAVDAVDILMGRDRKNE